MTKFGTSTVAISALAAGILMTACASTGSAPAALGEASATRALIEKTLAARAEPATRQGLTGAGAMTARSAAQSAPAERFADNAQAALTAGEYAEAVQLAERAIALDPEFAAPRQTLARGYFAAGRFRSARAAYGDLMVMQPRSTDHKVGAAIAALALGDTADTRALLAAAGEAPERIADVGLIHVLLGDTAQGIDTLEASVRGGRSSARTRQNLALAMAMAGRWNDARATAAIDLPPQEVERRVAAWAALAVSEDSAWRTVTLLGISPSTLDPGRPLELAYSAAAEGQDYAEGSPLQNPQSIEPVIAAVDLTAAEAAAAEARRALDRAARQPTASVIPAALVKASAVNVAPAARRARTNDAPAMTPVLPKRKQTANIGALPAAKPAPAAQSASAAKPAPGPEAAANTKPPLPRADGGEWLVQLGSYMNDADLRSNWQVLQIRSAFLENYQAMRSRTRIDGTIYHRLSVGRFGSVADAQSLCRAVKASGDTCFVRSSSISS